MRLTSLDQIPAALRPGYTPAQHGTGIVHLGTGAFHKAHQAAVTDAALAASGGDWRITGVSLRSPDAARALNPQNGLYTLIERGAGRTHARVIGAIAGVIEGANNPAQVLKALTAPTTKIVSLTVTEKAYGLIRATRTCDPDHPAVAADLANPDTPQGVLGLITRALTLRQQAKLPPFTVLCCDNLPDNGALLRGATLDFARHLNPALADYIAEIVAFPATMVDRITPAASAETYAEALRQTGCTDLAAIETEPFLQWVIEDHFPQSRPNWEAGGAVFVTDVAPYEAMKLRMLNGTHSMLAYAGFLAGHAYVRDTTADPALARLIQRHFQAAAATLPPLSGLDTTAYAAALTERFANPAIAHQTYQIAMDGTEKLPQRLFSAATDALHLKQPLRPFAFATAAWMRYTLGRHDTGEPYALRDPREAEIAARLAGLTGASDIAATLMTLPNFLPAVLAQSAEWQSETTDCLTAMLTHGVVAAILAESRVPCA